MSTSGRTDDPWLARCATLERELGVLGSVAVAYSGGVDSSVLLHAACNVLGQRAVGLIADSPSLPRAELALARATAEAIGARLVVLPTAEMDDERYLANRGDRCYFCKAALFEVMEAWAREHGFAALAFGEIVDDALDDRPGARAAAERGVVAPLRAARFGKEDVRRYAREHGLPVAEKPASACLASRIPLGTRVTRKRLATVERAEAALAGLGLRVLRVRHHGARARVEVGPDELPAARAHRAEIEARLAAEGFQRIELAAYRTPGAPAGGLTGTSR